MKVPTARILVIDDNPGVVDLLATVLGEEGYGVSGAVTSDEGLKLFSSSHPELVLLDIAVPGMNGIEMLKRIRSIAPTARVVMVSGDAALSHEALELGALACIGKPFDWAYLKRIVAAALQVKPQVKVHSPDRRWHAAVASLIRQLMRLRQ